ncbi:PEP-CTERM sorting domain-containing protein [Massilia sp. Dwa41.01b]|nr:PEP-CTERM sorting domain-containing protein [Massilia sp. Dwa41.01b]
MRGTPSEVPEPASLALILGGALALAARRRAGWPRRK